MEFGVLGPLEVRREGGRIPLPRPKQRALLAFLLLRANELVPSDRLIDLLWGEAPPKAATTALRGHVSQLRKVLGKELIETRPPGYVLRIAPEQLDFSRFQRLVAEARALEPEERAIRLSEALALFRGEPLADLAQEGLLQAELDRLAELRLAALEQRVEAELELGRAGELVGELEGLVAQHPLRERLRGQLMLALYRSGRQVEALEVYRQLRLLLADELGLEPSPALKRLEREILSQDPSLEPEQRQPALALGLREERKRVSVLACGASDEDAAAVRAELERLGGTVERLPADTLLCLFGAPLAHEDDPERAVRAALAARVVLGGRLRAAVTTGEALVTLGERSEGDPLAAGEPVSLAVRLQHAAPGGAILVDAPTYRATEHALQYRRSEPFELGGGRPTPHWSALKPRTRPRRRLPKATPFVGRTHELGLLGDIAGRCVRERELQLVTVVGVPGIGKTRLLSELQAVLEERGGELVWRRGRCLPYGEGVGLSALGEIVKAQCGVGSADSEGAAEKKLGRTVHSIVQDEAEAAWIELHLRPLAGLPARQERPPERTELFAAWRTFLEAAAEARPLALLFEDLHWADDGLLAFVDELVDRSTSAPLFVCSTTRPELFDRSPGWSQNRRNAAVLSLTPLSAEETAKLLSGVLLKAVLPAQTQAELLERAGGNPLYAEEFARLLGQGRRGLPATVPETLQALIAARLDTLPPARKAILQDAAVVGQVFWTGALAAIAARDRAGLEEELHELARREFSRASRRFTFAGEREYSFAHALIREAAYAQIPRTERAAKHAAAGDWLQHVAGDRLGDYAEQLAYHYGEALDLSRRAGFEPGPDLEEKTRRFLLLAGDRALALDVPSATEYYRRALELVPPGHPQRGDVLLKAGKAADAAGAFAEGGHMMEEAAKEFRARGDRRGAAAALARLADVGWMHSSPRPRTEFLAEARELLAEEPDAPEWAAVHSMTAREASGAGDTRAAVAGAEQAIVVARQHGLLEEELEARSTLGAVRCNLGDLGGLDDLREALRMSLELGLSLTAAWAYTNLCLYVAPEKGLLPALELEREAIEFSERRGTTVQAMASKCHVVAWLYELGRWEEMLPLAEEVIDWERGRGATLSGVVARRYKTFALRWRGEVADAASMCPELLSTARGLGRPQALVLALAAAAEVELARGRRDAALTLVEEFDRESREAPYYWSRPIDLPRMLRVCVTAGEATLAARLVAGTDEPRFPVETCALASARAIIAEAESRLADAVELHSATAEGWANQGWGIERAHALFGAGRCLLGLRRRKQAERRLAEAREIFASAGASVLVAEIDARAAKKVQLTA